MSRRELIHRAKALGYAIEAIAGGHLRLRHPLRRHGALAAPDGCRREQGDAKHVRPAQERQAASCGTSRPRSPAKRLRRPLTGWSSAQGRTGRRVLEGLLGGRPMRRPITADRYLWRPLRWGGLAVSFQEVVHPVPTGEAEVVEALATRGGTGWTSTRMPA